jgi:hypothetical protein
MKEISWRGSRTELVNRLIGKPSSLQIEHSDLWIEKIIAESRKSFEEG